MVKFVQQAGLRHMYRLFTLLHPAGDITYSIFSVYGRKQKQTLEVAQTGTAE